MRVRIDTKSFEKQLTNIANYSFGFIDGINRGKKEFLNNLGKGVILSLGQYIDSEARANSSSMHHVYEWYKTGSPSARLFNLDYTVSNLGLSINSNELLTYVELILTKSQSIVSETPFLMKRSLSSVPI